MATNMNINIHAHMYTYIYIYIYKYIYMYIYLTLPWKNVSTQNSPLMCVNRYIYITKCMSLSLSIYVCMYSFEWRGKEKKNKKIEYPSDLLGPQNRRRTAQLLPLMVEVAYHLRLKYCRTTKWSYLGQVMSEVICSLFSHEVKICYSGMM
jgi:hypothetical protein